MSQECHWYMCINNAHDNTSMTLTISIGVSLFTSRVFCLRRPGGVSACCPRSGGGRTGAEGRAAETGRRGGFTRPPLPEAPIHLT